MLADLELLAEREREARFSPSRAGCGQRFRDAVRIGAREQNRLKPTQAQTVIAAAILRHLHAVVTTGRAWDPQIAIHGSMKTPVTQAA